MMSPTITKYPKMSNVNKKELFEVILSPKPATNTEQIRTSKGPLYVTGNYWARLPADFNYSCFNNVRVLKFFKVLYPGEGDDWWVSGIYSPSQRDLLQTPLVPHHHECFMSCGEVLTLWALIVQKGGEIVSDEVPLFE
jgi:hypothetical protein